MPFGLGAITNYFVRTRKYKQHLDQVDAAIARLEDEHGKPVLTYFSGIELVDATIVLLDATLEKRIQESSGEKKLKWIKLYLERIEEVYLMNKDKLEDIPATRKEMLALGLAVRHIAVAIDQEFASLNALKSQVNQELQNVRSVTGEYAKSLQVLQSQIKHEIADNRATCDRQLELQKKAQDKTRVLAYVGIIVAVLVGLAGMLRFLDLF
jgi:hypothetical protein